MARSATISRRLKEKEDRKEHILAAAREVFFEDGIRRATVDAIAGRAEVAKGTVYLYFQTKETILAHLLLEGLDTLGERLLLAYDEAAALSGEARLRGLAAAYYDFYLDKQDYFRLMMAFNRGQFEESVNAELYEMILHRGMRALRWVAEAMQQAIDEEHFIPGDARHFAGIFWAALNGVLILTSHPLRRELVSQDVENLYQGVLDTMLRGLYAPN